METNLEERLLAMWNQRKLHKTIFAIISIVTPFVGLLLALSVVFFFQPAPRAHESANDMGIWAFGNFVGILFLSCVAGAVLSLIALIRRENQKAVITGLLLNCCPLFLLFILGR